MIRLSILILLSFSSVCHAQMTSEQLLNRAIAYHDPQGLWSTFAGDFKVVMKTPNRPDRHSIITIDLVNNYFNLSVDRNGKTSFREITNQQCRYQDTDGSIITTVVTDSLCERTVMYRNYYTYLYGLPMKLRDPGTIMTSDHPTTVNFQGKEYLTISVSYSPEVGTDVWQFYFDPETYRMEIYQFLKHGEPNTGEYILLTGEANIQGIRMPRDRAWYYNKDNIYLGTDYLMGGG
ncbi:MAG: DUF6503 family protein [Bacteroidota bacterium]